MPNFWGCRCCRCKNDTKIGLTYSDPNSPFHHFVAQWQIETGGEEWSVDVEAEDADTIGATASVGKGKWTSIGANGRIVVDSSGVTDRITESFGGLRLLQSRYKRLSLPKYHWTVPIYYDPQTVTFSNESRVTVDSVQPDRLTGAYGARIRPDQSLVVYGQLMTSRGGADYDIETGFWVYGKDGSLSWKNTWNSTLIGGALDNTSSTYGLTVGEDGAIYHYGRNESAELKMRKYSKSGSLIWESELPATWEGLSIVGLRPIEVHGTRVFSDGVHGSFRAFVTFDVSDGAVGVVDWPHEVSGYGRGHLIFIQTWDIQISRFSGWAVALVEDFDAGEWWFAGWPCLSDTLVSWIKKTADGDPVPNSGAWSIGPC